MLNKVKNKIDGENVSYKLYKKTSVWLFEDAPCFCSLYEILGTIVVLNKWILVSWLS